MEKKYLRELLKKFFLYFFRISNLFIIAVFIAYSGVLFGVNLAAILSVLGIILTAFQKNIYSYFTEPILKLNFLYSLLLFSLLVILFIAKEVIAKKIQEIIWPIKKSL